MKSLTLPDDEESGRYYATVLLDTIPHITLKKGLRLWFLSPEAHSTWYSAWPRAAIHKG